MDLHLSVRQHIETECWKELKKHGFEPSADAKCKLDSIYRN
jgi:hypothetical protein